MKVCLPTKDINRRLLRNKCFTFFGYVGVSLSIEESLRLSGEMRESRGSITQLFFTYMFLPISRRYNVLEVGSLFFHQYFSQTLIP